MATLPNAPLRDFVLDKTKKFTRSWQLYFKRMTERLQAIFPSLKDTPDIVWDDVRAPATALRAGTVRPPVWGQVLITTVHSGYGYFPVGYLPLTSSSVSQWWNDEYWPDLAAAASGTGLYTWLFEDQSNVNNEQQAFFGVQLPHTYKQGSALRPHIHWMKTDSTAGDVRWELEYSWASVGDILPGGNITWASTSDQDDDTEDRHLVTSFVEIDGADKRESSMLLLRIRRNSSNALDTYTGDAALLEVDFHFQVEKLGTGPEFPSAT